MNKIAKNASWIIICRIVQSMLNLAVTMITARYLGPSNYGLITYASSIVAFIVPLVQLGLNCILVQEFVDSPSDSGKTIGTATILCTISSILGVIGIWAFTSIVNRGETDTIIVSVLYSVSMFFQMTEMIQYWYQSKLISKYVSVVSLISRTIVSVYKIYIVIAGKNIYWFAIVNSLDYFIISICLFAIYFRLSGPKLTFSLAKSKRMLAKSKHFIIAGLMVSVFGQTDRIMLKLMIDDAASGYYSAAITCAGMTVFLFSAIIDSFRPVIFEHKKNNNESYKKNTILLYSIIIYIALAQSILLTIAAKPIIWLLYGEAYAPATEVLRIVTWYSAFSYIGSARGIWFLAEGKQKYIWITNAIGAIINVIGNFMLIPTLGPCGAALTSVITQIFANFIIGLLITPIRNSSIWMIEAINPKFIIKTIPYFKLKKQ